MHEELSLCLMDCTALSARLVASLCVMRRGIHKRRRRMNDICSMPAAQ